MQKLSIGKALKLLQLLGVPVAELVTDDKDATPDVKDDDVISAVDTSRSAILKPRWEQENKDANDAAFKGRMLGTLKSAIARAAGIATKDLDGFDSAEEMIKKALGVYDQKFSSDTQELRDKIKEMETAHTDAISAKEKDWQAKLDEANNKYIERDIDTALAKAIKAIPRTGGDEMVQALAYKLAARGKYHLHYNEKTQQVEFRKLDNHEVPVMNDANTLAIKPEDDMKEWLKSLGLAASDNRHQRPDEAQRRAAGEGGNGNQHRTEDISMFDDNAAHLESLMNG